MHVLKLIYYSLFEKWHAFLFLSFLFSTAGPSKLDRKMAGKKKYENERNHCRPINLSEACK